MHRGNELHACHAFEFAKNNSFDCEATFLHTSNMKTVARSKTNYESIGLIGCFKFLSDNPEQLDSFYCEQAGVETRHSRSSMQTHWYDILTQMSYAICRCMTY